MPYPPYAYGEDDDVQHPVPPGPAPTPLTRSHTLPAFPVDALPPWVADQVRATATATQTALDMAGTVAVGVLAACAGGRVEVEVRAGFREPTNLFTVVASAPGTRKSPMFRALTAPLNRAEQDLVERAQPVVVEAKTQRAIAEKAAEQARTIAGRAEGDQRDARTADAITAAGIAESITVPTLPRLLADDVTPEAAASLIAEQGGRLAIASAEGGLFDLLAGRYSNGTPNLDWALKGHAGDLLRVDRKGRPPEYVDRPALTMILAVQPAVLTSIAGNTVLRGRGLLARFLYAQPVNNVGHRLVGAPPVPADVSERYEQAVTALAVLLAEWTDPVVLTLDPDATDVLLTYEQAVEPRLRPTGNLGTSPLLTEWASKLVGAAVRLAGLIHVADDPTPAGLRRSISGATAQAAIRIADYFAEHAVATFELMAADPVLADARIVLDYLRRQELEEFTKRSLFTGLSRAKFPTVAALQPALEILETYGWISAVPVPATTGPGRPPSPSYRVHPATHAALSAESAQVGSAGVPGG